MKWPGFCGPFNAMAAPLGDGERLMNWMIEAVESPAAPTEAALLPTPGFEVRLTVPQVGTRGFLQDGDQLFAVVGTVFYEVFDTWLYVARGTVTQDQFQATLSTNGAGGQILITSGSNAYCYTKATLAFAQVLTGIATMGGAKDGFFLVLDGATGTVRLSGLNDGLTWDPLQFFAGSASPSPWVAMVVGNPEVWLLSENTLEAWYNSGASPQPFAPISGAFAQYGTRAPWSVRLVGNRLAFLGHSKEGSGQVMIAQGYSPQDVASKAVATVLGNIEREQGTDDCETLAYFQDGHPFIAFGFGAADRTLVYDVDAGAWHERGRWDAAANVFRAWRPRVHVHAFGQHLVGDRESGRIAEMSPVFGSEVDGMVMRRTRIPPPVWAVNRRRMVVSQLRLRMQAGIGLQSGQGSDPQVLMRWSENGQTWSSERTCGAGAAGRFNQEVGWLAVGSSEYAFVPEITVSDPVPYRLLGLEMEGSGIKVGRG